MLEEYKALRTEIVQRIANQQQITSFAVGLFVAGIAAGQLLTALDLDPELLASLRPAYLVASLLFSAFALMNTEHDAMMITIANYIKKRLRPRIELLLKAPELEASEKENLKVLGWDEYRSEFQFQPDEPKRSLLFYFMTAARYLITIGPSVGLLIIYWWNSTPDQPPPIWESALFGFALVTMIFVLVAPLYTGTLYIDIGREEDKEDKEDKEDEGEEDKEDEGEEDEGATR